jgi:hypothetical protein
MFIPPQIDELTHHTGTGSSRGVEVIQNSFWTETWVEVSREMDEGEDLNICHNEIG